VTQGRSRFYGWRLVATIWVCYGFGLSPAFTSWGFFAPEMAESLDLNRAQLGAVFGLFTFLLSATGPVVGYLQGRWSIRWVMVFGFALSSAGFLWTSRASALADCYLGFALLGGLGIGFSTLIPAQTLMQNWFYTYQARAMALTFTAGGVLRPSRW